MQLLARLFWQGWNCIVWRAFCTVPLDVACLNGHHRQFKTKLVEYQSCIRFSTCNTKTSEFAYHIQLILFLLNSPKEGDFKFSLFNINANISQPTAFTMYDVVPRHDNNLEVRIRISRRVHGGRHASMQKGFLRKTVLITSSKMRGYKYAGAIEIQKRVSK